MGDEDTGLDLTAENVERSLDEIRFVAARWPVDRESTVPSLLHQWVELAC